ncbi:TIGR03032 family protein [Marinoscillum sp. MHG1-6]|uniref:TIGR03032 family protein n=1 Tax=Marinoscillum sp. MHG1-6 TaxID=2959627 RepID=UPI00215774D9|nr:TIGR03032 family protein [Marinoscillum sp. MHG1-6]
MSEPPKPFSYYYSPNVPEILKGLNCSLAISTYQTGKVVLFSPQNEDALIQLPRNFPRPMGMATYKNMLAIALNSEILITANTPGLAANYPPNPGVYDAMYIPRSSFYTGTLDIHDLSWTDTGLIAVNTSFSCLMTMSQQMSFQPIWKPPFISALEPEDRCHLNGLAIKDGKIKYVTALGKGDSSRSWKENMLNGGILMDVESNEIILDELAVPHSPRYYDDGLILLLSATGQIVKVDPEKGTYEEITRVNGFLRGMDRVGDYLFVAMSKLRQSSSLFREAPIAKESVRCGVSIIYLPTGNQVGYIHYNTSVDELFEVKALAGTVRPNILNEQKGVHLNTVTTKEKVYWQEAQKQPTEENT